MKKTVLITGTSSGIGQAAVLEFAKQGWNVAATMRSPEKDTTFKGLANVKVYALDVTSPESIDKAMEAVVKDYGRLDVVVNNAGYGVDGAFEGFSDEVIEKQFDTNVFGLMRVTRAAIRIMREQGGGSIVQIASMGGRLAFPMFSIYHGTKWAVEGFTESLQYELAPFNIRVKIVEPGPIKTEFYGTSRHFVMPEHTRVYDAMSKSAEKVAADSTNKAAGPDKVAHTIIRAANSTSRRMRYAVGQPGPLLLWLRKRIPDTWFFRIVRMTYKL
jgi:NAD(P)-dependent dehydrogenase (short-subunit alcohol dehydrogenase family)